MGPREADIREPQVQVGSQQGSGGGTEGRGAALTPQPGEAGGQRQHPSLSTGALRGRAQCQVRRRAQVWSLAWPPPSQRKDGAQICRHTVPHASVLCLAPGTCRSGCVRLQPSLSTRRARGAEAPFPRGQCTLQLNPAEVTTPTGARSLLLPVTAWPRQLTSLGSYSLAD